MKRKDPNPPNLALALELARQIQGHATLEDAASAETIDRLERVLGAILSTARFCNDAAFMLRNSSELLQHSLDRLVRGLPESIPADNTGWKACKVALELMSVLEHANTVCAQLEMMVADRG